MVTLHDNEQVTLQFTDPSDRVVIPDDFEDIELLTSDAEVATASKGDGVIIIAAEKPGIATITMTDSTGFRREVDVTVIPSIEATLA